MIDPVDYHVRRGYRNAMTLASDVPDLPARIISEGYSALKTHGSVIGSSPDGGYYLIGFQGAWSTDSTFNDTIDRLKEAEIDFYVLPAWRDVDTIYDLRKVKTQSSARQER